MLSAFVLYGFQLSIAISELEGRTLTAREGLQIGLKRCLALFAATLLVALGTSLGMIFLLVPGIILAVVWAVTLPAVVVRGGVLAGLQDSRDLTRGNRWRIFGLAVATFVVMLVVQGILGALFGGFNTNNNLSVMTAVGSLVLSAYSLAASVVLTAGSGALYVQLRELKGGGGESVAQVFS
jgi:hypothetical protein